MSDKGFGLADDKPEGGPRPAGRTILGRQEITPEMIDAGLEELGYYNPANDDITETVIAIYTAMVRAGERSGA